MAKPTWTLDQIVDNLNRSGAFWQGNTITYSFAETLPVEYNGVGLSFSSFSSAQRTAAREAMKLWDDVMAVSLVETSGSDGDIRLFNSDLTGVAGAFLPNTVVEGLDVGGDVHVNPDYYFNSQLGYGDYGLTTMIHEIGHALGLEHPGPYNAGNGQEITYENNAEYKQDTLQYTLMSYFGAFNSNADHISGQIEYIFPAAPLLHDIAAVQDTYGANTTTRTGDTVYGFNSTAGRDAFDFSVNSDPVIAIWDAGGVDTLDFSGFTYGTTIDLREGHFSSTPFMSNNVVIAHGVTIENAVGGSGQDTIHGNNADNVLFGGEGKDDLSGHAGNDSLFGGAAADVIRGGDGDDYIDGGDWFDRLWGDPGNDIMFGGAKDDNVYGGRGDDTVHGGTGNDQLRGDEGDDLLYGEEGGDSIRGGTGQDTLFGGEGFDFLTAGEGDDYLYGGADGDRLVGEAGNDFLYGGGARDQIWGSEGNDSIFGGEGNDTIFGGDDVDVVVYEGDAKNFEVTRDYLGDIYVTDLFLTDGDEGTDKINSDVEWIYFDDLQVSTADLEIPEAPDLVVNGTYRSETLVGNTGNDTLYGNRGTDTLFGYEGDDVLEAKGSSISGYGGTGNDLLIGGQNIDWLYGEAGNDTLIGGGSWDFLFGGDGDDTLIASTSSDSLFGGEGIDTAVFAGKRSDYWIYDHQVEGFNRFIVNYQGKSASRAGSSYVYTDVERFQFADGTWLTTDYPENVEPPVSLRAKANGGALSGGGGDDTIIGANGNDRFYGYDGDDYLNAKGGTNRVYGGAGNDRLYSSSGRDSLYGEDGNDYLRSGGGNDKIYGGEGDDRAIASSGNDKLYGQGGNDYLHAGSGNDRVDGGDGDDRLIGHSGHDRLYGRDGDDIMIGGSGNDRMYGHAGNDTISGNSGDDRLYGYDGDDVMSGSSGNDRMYAHDGNDYMSGGSGHDRMYGYAGNDYMVGGSGDDRMSAHSGDDYLNGGSGKNRMYGGDGNDTLVGGRHVDKLYGQSGDDTLTGGGGRDTMIGGSGNDTYFTDGRDTIRESFDQGVDTVIVGRSFSLGSNLENLDLTGSSHINGSGNSLNNYLWGNSGNNGLYGGDGEDTLDGWLGNDFLVGGDDSDVFLFGLGEDEGEDIILDFDRSEDVLAFDDVFDGPGDDLADIDAQIVSIVNQGDGGDVIVEFASGTDVTFRDLGSGAAGNLGSIADLVDDASTQISTASAAGLNAGIVTVNVTVDPDDYIVQVD